MPWSPVLGAAISLFAGPPIIGGTPSTDDDAVALLVSYPPDRSTMFTCTADLIAPTILLTSAHCVDAPNHPGHIFGVYFGDDASAYPTLAELEPQLAPVAAVHAHPAYNPEPPFDADLGIVELASPAPAGLTPLPLNRAPVTSSLVGSPARIVGFGQTTYGTFNLRRHQATTVVAGLDPGDTIRVGDGTRRSCLGDSGGPALIDVGGVETIFGIDSYTDNPGCIEPAHYTRVDRHLSFIDPFLGILPPDAGVEIDASEVDAGGDPDASRGANDGGGGCSVGAPARRASAAATLVLALAAALLASHRSRPLVAGTRR